MKTKERRTSLMDYKAVIEEQIRELQKVQDRTIKGEIPSNASIAEESRKTAQAISNLCRDAASIGF